jgi:hypothetical protein
MRELGTGCPACGTHPEKVESPEVLAWTEEKPRRPVLPWTEEQRAALQGSSRLKRYLERREEREHEAFVLSLLLTLAALLVVLWVFS